MIGLLKALLPGVRFVSRTTWVSTTQACRGTTLRVLEAGGFYWKHPWDATPLRCAAEADRGLSRKAATAAPGRIAFRRRRDYRRCGGRQRFRVRECGVRLRCARCEPGTGRIGNSH